MAEVSSASTSSQINTPSPETTYSELSEQNVQDGQPYSDMAMVQLCRIEMERAIGFENDQVLRNQRLLALDLFKGDTRDHIPSLPNRSAATSADVADAVETILPDLMEIFTAQGDVVTFKPVKPGDEQAARQETDYLNHVIFQDNDGFWELMSGLKDGMITKVALFEFDWKKDFKDEYLCGKSLQDLLAAHQSGEVFDVTPDKPEEQKANDKDGVELSGGDGPAAKIEGDDYTGGQAAYDVAANSVEQLPDEDEDGTTPSPVPQQTYSFTLRQDRSKAMFWAHPGEDFAVSPETVRLPEATYCCARYRPRVQDLIADGYDEIAVKKIEPYIALDQQTQLARDTVGEHLNSQQGDFTNQMLRQVEIRKHYIRLLDPEGGGFSIWRIVTNRDGSVGIPKDGKLAHKVNQVPFAAGSPYVIPHRFHGFSVADQLVETMKIKTILTRALLDSSYFALNARYEIDMSNASDYTIEDLLRNEPMAPVRSKNGEAVRPLQSAQLGFDAYAALEYFSTVGEQRSGVMRNAQGLNPDTLHDTAKGAMALLNAAQRRVRMIARVLAETCIKDLYLGLHALIRDHAEQAVVAQVNGSWTQIDPTQWGERVSMSIEVGLGSAGREQDMAAFTAITQDMEQIVTMQGGLNGPLVTAENAYNMLTDKARALGRRQPERYYTDPKTLPPPPPPPPDPKVMAMQLQAQQKAQQAQMNAQIQQQKNQADIVLQQQEMQNQAALKKYQIDQANQTDIATAAISAHASHAHGGEVSGSGDV